MRFWLNHERANRGFRWIFTPFGAVAGLVVMSVLVIKGLATPGVSPFFRQPTRVQLEVRDAQSWYVLGKRNGERWWKVYHVGEQSLGDHEVQAAAETMSRSFGVQDERDLQAFRDGFSDGLRTATQLPR